MQQWNYVSKIIIDPNNTNYIIENGCLLSYDKTILIACLTFETDFVVPKTVKKIESHAFCIKSLKSIFISTNVNEIVGNPFPSEVDIASSSSMFISENNILYNSDKSILIASASRDNVIEIPESVVEIGIKAFKPAFPQEIILPNKLKRINDYAFYSIENILITTLPEALEYIGEGCLNIFGFCACLPPKITYIGSNAFEYCAYEFVSIPESLSEIEPYTFSNNSDLEKIQIPYSLCSIGEYAFSNCVSLKEFTIPYNTSIISDGLFSSCKSLKIIELHDHITKIGDCAFENCNCLEEFSIPKSVETIIGNPFKDIIKIDKFISLSPNYIIQDGILFDSDKTRIISCQSNTRVINIPDTVTEIEPYAFSNTLFLEEVYLPPTIKHIGDGTFSGCRNLKKVSLPKSLSNIPDYCFSHCASLESVVIPESVISIGSNAFSWCESLKIVNIPEALSVINDYSFCYCSSLENITFHNGIESIRNYAFWGCNKLKHVQLPQELVFIGNSAFMNCESLMEIIIPDSVIEIAGFVFSGCSALKKVTLGQRVACLGQNPFVGCNNAVITCLTPYFIFENDFLLTKDRKKLISCITKKDVVSVPNTVEIIEDYAFIKNPDLVAICLTKNVNKIGASSFAVSVVHPKIYYPKEVKEQIKQSGACFNDHYYPI